MDSDDEVRIRNHTNRAGEADDDNKYESVKKVDDESIDDDGSDVGWNSDDELAFLSSTKFFKKNKANKNKKGKGKNKKEVPESEEEDENEYDEEEGLAQGGMLLSDMLFKNISAANSSSSSSSKPVAQDSDEEDDSEEEEEEDGEEGSDENESDEEEDDEEDGSDEGSEESNSDEESDVEDEEELENVHSRLLDAIDRFAKPSSSSQSAATHHKILNQGATESVYSSVLNNNNNKSSGDVSLNALLGALDDTRGLGVVKKHLADLEKGLAAPVHLEKVTADRMERSHIYAAQQEDMQKWQGTVVANRHVGTLDLAGDKRQSRSFKSMVNRFVPTTDMEKEIQMVLVQHGGATDADAEQKEIDELQGRNLSMQEIREKQAELAKVKALMFYDQQKRHRLNKIKSKAYRKIQKHKRDKVNGKKGTSTSLDDADEEEKNEGKEKDAYNRVKERMDLRHKNTSKWAKMAIQYGQR